MPNKPSPLAFHVMLKPRGAICNLGCEYCYFLSKENLYPESAFWMEDDILESFTRQYIGAQRVPEVTFAWQGGEPTLMGLDFFEKAVGFQKKYARPGMKINNALQTNGTMLDDDWGRFFKTNDFLIGLSIDGPQDVHDAYRHDKGGKPTFDRVMGGLEILKRHKAQVNALTTVHAANALHPLKVYHFLRDVAKFQFIQFIPIVERDNTTGFQEGSKVTKRSVTGVQYGQFLIQIFDEWVRRDVAQVFIQIFDVALDSWERWKNPDINPMEKPFPLCIFSPICGKALVMEHNGDLYACDHFVEPRHILGNIQESCLVDLVSHARQVKFGRDKLDKLPKYCLNCEVRFACHGGCPKNRFIRTPKDEGGLNYLCRGYKDFFKHIDEPMRMMAYLLSVRQPPAEIMNILARKKQ